MDRIRKHYGFLRRLVKYRADRRRRNRELEQANRGELCALCEVIKNLLHNPSLQIRLSRRQRERLRRHRKLLQKLLDRQVNGDEKRHLLQRGAGGFLLPLILGLVGPVVSKLLQ